MSICIWSSACILQQSIFIMCVFTHIYKCMYVQVYKMYMCTVYLPRETNIITASWIHRYNLYLCHICKSRLNRLLHFVHFFKTGNFIVNTHTGKREKTGQLQCRPAWEGLLNYIKVLYFCNHREILYLSKLTSPNTHTGP